MLLCSFCRCTHWGVVFRYSEIPYTHTPTNRWNSEEERFLVGQLLVMSPSCFGGRHPEVAVRV